MNRIEKTAVAAGEWWARRLDDSHADRRPAFAAAVAARTKAALKRDGRVLLEVDYDANEPLLAALKEAGIGHNGFMYGDNGILPTKTYIDVTPGKLRPKEGYGRWSPEIEVR